MTNCLCPQDAEMAWRVTAEQVMRCPEEVEEEDFRMLFEQMERGHGYPLDGKERLVKSSKALQAKQMIHRGRCLSKEEATAGERLARAMAALGGDDFGTYKAMAESLQPRPGITSSRLASRLIEREIISDMVTLY